VTAVPAGAPGAHSGDPGHCTALHCTASYGPQASMVKVSKCAVLQFIIPKPPSSSPLEPLGVSGPDGGSSAGLVASRAGPGGLRQQWHQR
jgi:hypothetical protein